MYNYAQNLLPPHAWIIRDGLGQMLSNVTRRSFLCVELCGGVFYAWSFFSKAIMFKSTHSRQKFNGDGFCGSIYRVIAAKIIALRIVLCAITVFIGGGIVVYVYLVTICNQADLNFYGGIMLFGIYDRIYFSTDFFRRLEKLSLVSAVLKQALNKAVSCARVFYAVVAVNKPKGFQLLRLRFGQINFNGCFHVSFPLYTNNAFWPKNTVKQ